jgi:hypothetical protein
MSALRLINETSASSVSSVSVTDVFTSDFDIYCITLPNYVQGATDKKGYLRFLNSSGSEITSASYDQAGLVYRAGGAFAEIKDVNDTEMWHSVYNNVNESDWGAGTMWVFNPYSNSSYTFLINQTFFRYNGVVGGTTGFEGYKQIGVLKTTDSITGIKYFNELNQNFTNFKVNIYGLRVDNG